MSKYLVEINLPFENYAYYSILDSTTLLTLLNDTLYDWAKNLILYSLYKKNANMIYAFDILDRKTWINYFKEKDIQYWKSFLTKDKRRRTKDKGLKN